MVIFPPAWSSTSLDSGVATRRSSLRHREQQRFPSFLPGLILNNTPDILEPLNISAINPHNEVTWLQPRLFRRAFGFNRAYFSRCKGLPIGNKKERKHQKSENKIRCRGRRETIADLWPTLLCLKETPRS